MEKRLQNRLIGCIRQVVGALELRTEPDQELLRRFLGQRDEAAFAAVIRRHGPMVLRVAFRTLQNEHDAEDVFQATFLVLSQKAHTLRRQESLGSWLYGIAYRLALKTKSMAVQRRNREPRVGGKPVASPLAQITVQEAQTILDEELTRLPKKLREPVVLCCLEGLARDEAAKEIGCPASVLKSRLEQARERLRQRLIARGLTLPCGLGAFLLLEGAAGATLSPALIGSTTKAAIAVAAGKAASTVVTAKVAALTEGVLKTMLLTKIKIAGVALAVAIMGLGGGMLTYRMHTLLTVLDGAAASDAAPQGPKQETVEPIADQGAKPGVEAPLLDHYGDPLPPGAIARLGTVRFRTDSGTWAMTFSRDGKMLVGNTAGRLVVWDAATGKERYRLPVEVRSGHPGGGPFAVSPDGATLAIIELSRSDRSPTISLWEPRTGKQIRSLALPESKDDLQLGSILCYAPDGNSLDMACGGKLFVLDVATCKVRASFGNGRAAIYGLACSPDGKTLAIGTHNPGLQFWDIASGKMIRGIGDPANSSVGAVAFSADGKMLAAGGWDRIILYDPNTGKELRRLEAEMQAVNGLAFTPDGKTLVSGSTNGGIRVWDVPSGKIRFTCHPGMIGRSMALSPDGTTAAMGTAGEAVCLWNVATGKRLFTEFDGHGSWVNSLAFSRDGKTLASGEFYHQIRLWDTGTWKTSRTLPGRAWFFSFSPDNKRLASVPRAETVDIWNLDTAKKAMTIKVADSDDVRMAMFSADGRKLITLDRKSDSNGRSAWEPHHVRQWDAVSSKEEKRWIVPGHMYEPVMAPNGMAVLVANGDTIRLHDVPSGRDRRFRSSGKEEMHTLAVSPDGRLLASGDLGGDRAVRFWELATGQEIHIVKGHQLAATCAAWSPDGRILASGDSRSYGGPDEAANTVRLWDASTGKQLVEYSGFNTSVMALAFSPDGAYLAAGLRDSTILVWDVRRAARAAKLEAKQLTAEGLADCWAGLADRDARKAHQAIWALVAAPKQSVPFLLDRLKPVAAADAGKIQRWIADLDSEQFSVRQAAAKELEKLGGQVEAPVRKALSGTLSLESRRRLEQVLEAVHSVPGPTTIRDLRAIMVLEKIGSPEAMKLLELLARGALAARQTREANQSLDRLTRGVNTSP